MVRCPAPSHSVSRQALHEELVQWPFLNDEETLEKGQTAAYAEVTDTGQEEGELCGASA